MEEKEKLCCDFCDIVSSIALLTNPLFTLSLAKLLHIEKTDVDDQLCCLHFILWVSSNSYTLVHLLHLSFQEFLMKKAHSDLEQQFMISEFTSHRYLTDKCLRLLQSSEGLCKSVCQLEHSEALQSKIDSTIIDTCIPQHVQCTCCYWVYHIQQSTWKISDSDNIDCFLQQHFLHWLEYLSLINKVSESIDLIETLQTLLIDNDSSIFIFL